MIVTGEWSGSDWSITIGEAGLSYSGAGNTGTVSGADRVGLDVRRRRFRWSLFHDGRRLLQLRGLAGGDARSLRAAIERLVLKSAYDTAVAWHSAVVAAVDEARTDQRWLSAEIVDELESRRPESGLVDRACEAGCEADLTPKQREAALFVDVDLRELASETNEYVLAAERTSSQEFFDTIDKDPLTDEQVRAVVCFDNRVQVSAAAGSGKTALMVARAAYAVKRGFVAPDRILLLAFNKDAATQLATRVKDRFAAAGLPADGVRAETLHSFGLEVLGRATNKKPSAVTAHKGLKAKEQEKVKSPRLDWIERLVEGLREQCPDFHKAWDVYQQVLATSPWIVGTDDPTGSTNGHPDNEFRTAGGDRVRSVGEQMIANYLHLHGVDYLYERPYDVDVSDATHSQYKPDFYYPAIDVWHEHWAVGQNGEPPKSFAGYAEGMAWKRQLHAHYGSILVESTAYEVEQGEGLSKLIGDLEALGLELTWEPSRPADDSTAEHSDDEPLYRLLDTFMGHVKSNSHTPATIDARLDSEFPHLRSPRTEAFLDVYWKVHNAWDVHLADRNEVDFDDMILRAADCLERGDAVTDFDLVLVDEFQDSSEARCRLIAGLVGEPGRYLLAVGDDWQSINGFAGADPVAVATFEERFGRGEKLALTTTFRCSETISGVASSFVLKNPSQDRKAIRSARDNPGLPVRVIVAKTEQQALRSYLEELSETISGTAVETSPGRRVTVFVLGRYRHDAKILGADPPSNLDVSFSTIHTSKGLEADYVVVVGLKTGTQGFPSTIADDPVLNVAMPTPEAFEHAEERRLLYVALTRARHQAVLIAPRHEVSPFAAELLGYPGVHVDTKDDSAGQLCSRCRSAMMVQRNGPRGAFLGCASYPTCDHTQNFA